MKEGHAMYSVVLMAALSTGGDAPAFGRHGCWGGGCWGCYGCCGCWGGCWGGCYGCWGCYGGWGGGYGYAYAAPVYGGYGYASASPLYAAPVIMTASAASYETPTVAPPPTDAARVVVDLPADAKLFVNDQPTKSTAARRVFQSPRLDPGSRYSYLLRAELQRDGKKYEQTKKISVRPGQETTASFTESDILASSPSSVPKPSYAAATSKSANGH